MEYCSTIGGPGGGSGGAPEGGERSGAVVPRDFLARRMASLSSSTADGGGVMVGVVSLERRCEDAKSTAGSAQRDDKYYHFVIFLVLVFGKLRPKPISRQKSQSIL